METPLDRYLAELSQVPRCEAVGFQQALAAWRAGDEGAGRQICGGCLWLVFDLAERKWRRWDRHLGAELLDMVQDGNAALLRALKTFQGSTLDEFLPHVEHAVRQELHDLP